ncbi:MAG: myo-inositol 2-dehydrogenase / D-chiro-inositol 1-dehydrogenase [Micromonosporaceae bacterium]
MEVPSARPLGVGVLGPGRAAQAIHIPALAELGERFRVVHVAGPDAAVAASVAASVGARHSVTEADLLADPAVEVVAICSPLEFHAAQAAAACAAGKRAVLCEKPFAATAAEAARIVAASASSGTPVFAGTMHAHDPAYLAAQACWAEPAESVRLVRSVIQLPHNVHFEQLATEVCTRSCAGDAPDDLAVKPEEPPAAEILRGWILGLAVHVAPLLRRFAGGVDRVTVARLLRPYGYCVSFAAGDASVQLIGYIHDSWQPRWTFTVIGTHQELRVEFPPSYVRAGSAVAELRDAAGVRRWGPFPHNAHTAIWSHIADVLAGTALPRAAGADAAADLAVALDLASAAAPVARWGQW